MPAEDSSPWLSALSFRWWQLAVATPWAVGPQHADQLAPLPAPPHLLSEGDTGRGWEELAAYWPYNMHMFMLPLSWENKEGGWVERVPHCPQGKGKDKFPSPLSRPADIGCHPTGYDTCLSLNFLICVKVEKVIRESPVISIKQMNYGLIS